MPRWTDDELRAAVAANRNISQTLQQLGLRPVGGNYDTIRRRISELAIDTGHWGRELRITVPEATLRDVVASSRSVAACLRLLGWPEANSSRRRFERLVALYGIDTGHFLGQRANLGRQFPQFVRPIERYLVLDGPRITSTWLRLRLLDERLLEACCALCGRDTWTGRPIPLELDHINGNRYDNRFDNLRLLCPNCHALTPNYRGRNRGRYAMNPA